MRLCYIGAWGTMYVGTCLRVSYITLRSEPSVTVRIISTVQSPVRVGSTFFGLRWRQYGSNICISPDEAKVVSEGSEIESEDFSVTTVNRTRLGCQKHDSSGTIRLIDRATQTWTSRLFAGARC